MPALYRLLSWGVFLTSLGLTDAVHAQSRVYTVDADFDEGTLVNLNHNAPNNDQLQLNEGTAAFPFVNVAASDRGTIVRIDTETGDIIGEYWTSPDGQAKNPSRTTVDQFGNVWVGNRNAYHFLPGDPDPRGSLTRVGLIRGGTRTDDAGTPDAAGQYLAPPYDYNTCVDKDSDGLIKTSMGLGNYLAWTNAGGADTYGGTTTAEDECILNYTIAGSPYTRTIAIDQNNDVWVGGTGTLMHEKVDGVTGNRVPGTSFTFSCGGYGGFIDGNNVLWSMTSGSSYLRYDLTAGTGTCLPLTNYGTGVDPNTGEVWVTQLTGNTVHKVAPDGTLLGSFTHGNEYAQGVVVDGDGNVWVAHSLFGATTVGHLKTDGTYIGNVTLPGGNGPTGVAVDADGNVWAANINTSNAMRIDPNGGPIGADGVTPIGAVDLTVDLNMSGLPNAGPYNYSDMTGSVVSGTTAPSGTWTVVYDGGAAGVDWDLVSWNGSVPAGSSISVEVRAADTEAGLGSETYAAISNGVPFGGTGIEGQYIQIRTTLARSASAASPVLYDLTVSAAGDGGDLACSPEAPLYWSDWDVDPSDGPADPRGEFVELSNDGGTGAAIDLTPCDLISFNPFTEIVTYAADATGAIPDGGTYSFMETVVGNGQMMPANSLYDDPSVWALVEGSASAGQDVGTVLANTDVVAAVVLTYDGSLFASVRGGASASAANAEEFLAALAELLAVEGEKGGSVDLRLIAAPNPASSQGAVSFGLADGGDVTVALYDALGRQVALLAEGTYGPGRHRVDFDASALPAGVYVVRMLGGADARTARLTVAR